MVLVSLATVERRRGRPAEALRLVEESFELGRRLAYEDVNLYCLLELAALPSFYTGTRRKRLACRRRPMPCWRSWVSLCRLRTRKRAARSLSFVEALFDDDACAEALAAGRRMSSEEAIERDCRSCARLSRRRADPDPIGLGRHSREQSPDRRMKPDDLPDSRFDGTSIARSAKENLPFPAGFVQADDGLEPTTFCMASALGNVGERQGTHH